MGEPRPEYINPISIDFCSQISAASMPSPPPVYLTLTLVQPTQRKTKKHQHPKPKVYRALRSAFRALPIISPSCKFPVLPVGFPDTHRGGVGSGTRVTGTLFGYRKGKVSFSLQENPRCLPSLVIELSIQTNVLQREMSFGMVRIALECEKRPAKDHHHHHHNQKVALLEEPMWTMYCNGKKATGMAVMREATSEDLNVMEVLKAVSVGAGALPGSASEIDGPEGEMAYIRAHYDQVVGSKDSETLYMLGPDGHGAELAIFFVRV